jgi:hypothetical protein
VGEAGLIVGPHRAPAPTPAGLDAGFPARCGALAALEPAARFHARHGAILADVFEILPSLTAADGARDVQTAATVLTLLEGLGGDVFLELWAGGRLDRLLLDVTAGHAAALAALERALADTGRRVTATVEQLDRTRARLEAIESTRAWRLTTAFYRLRDAARRS